MLLVKLLVLIKCCFSLFIKNKTVDSRLPEASGIYVYALAFDGIHAPLSIEG